MKISKLHVSELSTNCYILNNDDKIAVVIDAGGSFPTIKKYITDHDLTVKAIFLTHGHFDHIGAVNELKKFTGAKVYIHKEDEELVLCPQKSLSTYFTDFGEYVPIKADVLFDDGDKFSVDDMHFEIVHTSGHTKGSCVLLCENAMFSGDTLFKNACGRTDLYGGNMNTLKESLKKLANLEGDYTVLPGHGDQTELSYERMTNPYMGTNYDDIF